MTPLAFICATGSVGPQVRSVAERVVCDFHLSPLARLKAGRTPTPGSPLASPQLAAYAGCIGQRTSWGLDPAVGILAYDYDENGCIIPRPTEPSVLDGPVRRGKAVVGTHIFVGVVPGRGVDKNMALVGAVAASMYLSETTGARPIVSVEKGSMEARFARVAPGYAVSPLPTSPGLATFSLSLEDDRACRLAGETLAEAGNLRFQERIALQIQPLLDRIKQAGGQQIALLTF